MTLDSDDQNRQQGLMDASPDLGADNTGQPQISRQSTDMSRGQERTVLGIFVERHVAEAAVQQLRQQGFTTNEISVIAKEAQTGEQVEGHDTDVNPLLASQSEEQDAENYVNRNAYKSWQHSRRGEKCKYPFEPDRMRHTNPLANGIFAGGTIGGMGAFLAAAGTLIIPGIGPIIALGPLAAVLSGAVAGGIVGGLIDFGIPAERGRAYETEIQEGKVLAVIRSEGKKVNQAALILRQNGAKDVEVH